MSKLALTGFSQKEGGLVASSGPEYGQSQRKTVMALFVSWTDSNLLPAEKHDEAASK